MNRRWCWQCPSCDETWVDWIDRCLECGTPQPAGIYDLSDEEEAMRA